MNGAYLPQHIRRARVEGRLLGQVRDLLIMRKPLPDRDCSAPQILLMQHRLDCELAKQQVNQPRAQCHFGSDCTDRYGCHVDSKRE
jgi:hypothetical protein